MMTADPVRLHHVEDGPADGPPVLLVGSVGSTLEMWEPQVPALVAAGRRVLRVDHRGHGGSPVPPGPYAIADLAGDVLALLDDLGLDRVDYVGLSMGGMVGMQLATEAPSRIGQLVLCATSAGFPDPSIWDQRAAAVASGGTEAIAESTVGRWFTPGWAAAHPDWVDRARRMINGVPDAGYIACAAALRDWRHVDRLGAITAPTLVLGGRHDPSTPIDPHTDTLAAGIPGAWVEVLDAAHLVTIERARQATELLLRHLDGG